MLFQVSASMSASANLFNMTEDVDFDPELYVIKLKEQMTTADAEYQKLRNELQGQCHCNILYESQYKHFSTYCSKTSILSRKAAVVMNFWSLSMSRSTPML